MGKRRMIEKGHPLTDVVGRLVSSLRWSFDEALGWEKDVEEME